MSLQEESSLRSLELQPIRMMWEMAPETTTKLDQTHLQMNGCSFLLAVGSFLLTAELFLLTDSFGSFLLTIRAFLLAIELLCLQWQSVV